MYTPDYKMAGDSKYVGVIKENNKTIMVGNVSKKSATEALRHAESYIHEHYMHPLRDKMLRNKYSFFALLLLAVVLFLRSITIPLMTNIAITLSVLAGTVVLLISGYFGVLWWSSYYEYRAIIESYETVLPNFFDKGKEKHKSSSG